MDKTTEIVITGLGVVSPIGSGMEAFWNSLRDGCSGVVATEMYTRDDVERTYKLPFPMYGQVQNLDTKRIKPRKNVKVMARDIQLGFVASDFAREDGKLTEIPVAPERQGIVFGALMIAVDVSELSDLYAGSLNENGDFVFSTFGCAMDSMYPLWMLKYLPNMTACHIGIANDLRGPSNTLVVGETGGVSAFIEASRVLNRGMADVMYTGGCASCAGPSTWLRYDTYEVSRSFDNPATAYRPFDVKRDGLVFGEGAGSCILETRESAEKRGVPVYAKLLGYAECSESVWKPALDFAPQPEEVKIDRSRFVGGALRSAIRLAMERANLKPEELAFVMASGNGSVTGDRVEAQAIADVLGSEVPVTCIKGATGYALCGSSSMEIVAATLALKNGLIPAAVNCDVIDPLCPINVVTGAPKPIVGKSAALIVSYNFYGQANVLILGTDA